MKSRAFNVVYRVLLDNMKKAPPVQTERWQGMDVKSNPASLTYEMMNVEFEVDLQGKEGLEWWQKDIRPNLPWADDHFRERVSGQPLNPGEEWKNWPWASSAEKFTKDKYHMFNHTYAERLWCRWPRQGQGGAYIDRTPGELRHAPQVRGIGMRGIGHVYGDLQDLVMLIANEPYTRQAYIPLFFPEDTGVGDGGRKPCTLGYQFMVRDDKLHIFYPMRSVDLRRHFRDDCYLAVRLLLWVLLQCREINPEFWNKIVPGTYAMWMTSLHCFVNDWQQLNRGESWDHVG